MSDTDWKEVSLDNEKIWDKEAPIEGTLVKVRSNVGPNESMMYTIKTKDSVLNVWGTTVIDNKLSQVPPGSIIRIEPLGQAKSASTGRTYQDFKVLFKDAPFKEVTDEFDGAEPLGEMPPDFGLPE